MARIEQSPVGIFCWQVYLYVNTYSAEALNSNLLIISVSVDKYMYSTTVCYSPLASSSNTCTEQPAANILRWQVHVLNRLTLLFSVGKYVN